MSAHSSKTVVFGARVEIPTPRKSGLTPLDLCLMGKGFIQSFKPMSRAQADTWADRAKAAGR